MHRFLQGLLILALLLVQPGSGAGQAPGAQLGRVVGPAAPDLGPDAQGAFRNWLRQVRAASGPERLEQRREMMREAARFMPQLLKELAGGASFNQAQIALVLMEVPDPRAADILGRLASGELRGDPIIAGLALGRVGSDRHLVSLSALDAAADPNARHAGLIAIGRLGTPEAGNYLLGQLKLARLDREREAVLLGLALGGFPDALAVLVQYARSPVQRLRQAAVAGLGYQEPGPARATLLAALRDREAEIRRLALEGLARQARGSLAREDLAHAELLGDRDERLAGRALLALAAAGGAEEAALVLARAGDPRPAVRVALAGACLLIDVPEAQATLDRLLKDPEGSVRACALLAVLGRTGRGGRSPDLAPFVADRDPEVRRAAVHGLVYQGGDGLVQVLVGLDRPDLPEDVRERARELLPLARTDPEGARTIVRARLQVSLDRAGAAASWNLNVSLNDLILRALNLDNALSTGGSGVAPGTGSGTGGLTSRARAAAARRAGPTEEDLRRHLDAYPYQDRRPAIEIPPAP